jgi:hypothetical protein
MDPLWLEYAHVLGAIVIFGTGLGTAFHSDHECSIERPKSLRPARSEGPRRGCHEQVHGGGSHGGLPNLHRSYEKPG